MSLADTAASGAAKTVLAQLVRAAIQLAGVVILSRVLVPEEFGLITMVTALIGIATVMGDFGLSAATIQAVQISQRQRSNLFWTNVALGALLTTAVYFCADLIAGFYGEPVLADIARVLSFTFLINSITSQFRAEVTRSMRFGRLALVDVIAPAIALVIGVFLAAEGAGVWALVAQQLTNAGVVLLFFLVVARWWPGLPGRAPMGGLFGFGAGTLGIQLVTYLSTNIDDVLIGRFWGASMAGYYSRAFQLFRLPMQQIAIPSGRVALPVLSRLQTEASRFESFFLRAQLVLAYVFGGAFFLMAAAADPLIDLGLGPGWDEAKPIFLILALGGVFQSVTFGYSWVFQAKGLVGYQLRFSLVGRSAMVALLFAGVPFGVHGVAIASALGQALMWVLYTAFAVNRAGLSRRRLALLPLLPFSAYAVAGAAAWCVSLSSPALPAAIRLILITLVFVAVIAVLAAACPPLRKQLQLVIETARRALKRNPSKGA